MQTLIVIVICLVCLQWAFRLSLDLNNETGDVIIWYNWFGERRFFVLIDKLF
jgi:hypothetical protein